MPAPKTPTPTPKPTKKPLVSAKKPALRPALRASAVLAYLQAHPTFLPTNAVKLAGAGRAQAPKQVQNVFSLHAAKAGSAEAKLTTLKKRYAQLISIAQANAEATTQAHAAALALVAANTPAAFSKALQGPVKAALGVQLVRLLKVAETDSATTLSAAQLDKLCPGPMVLGPVQPTTHATLLGPTLPTLKSCALLRLTHTDQPLGLLVLASEDASHFNAGQETGLVDFIRHLAALRVVALS